VGVEIINIFKENRGSNLFDISLGNIFIDVSPLARETKTNINYWDYTKIRSFCTVKKVMNKTKSEPIEWEKIFANDII